MTFLKKLSFDIILTAFLRTYEKQIALFFNKKLFFFEKWLFYFNIVF